MRYGFWRNCGAWVDAGQWYGWDVKDGWEGFDDYLDTIHTGGGDEGDTA